MSFTTLKDDLLAEFREERMMINDQLELLDPLGTSLRRPETQNLHGPSTLFIIEIIGYILCVCCLAFAILMHNIYPFSILNTALYNPELRSSLGGPNITLLSASVYTLVGIIAVCIFIIARLVRSVRLKNEVLQHAGRDVKTIVSQHLLRRAAMEAIEQRHLLSTTGVIPLPSSPAKVSANQGARNTGVGGYQGSVPQAVPA
jgi:hypothetical protein